VSIKVDREERPDIDSIYMNVCQMINGQGGWPLTIIMTPNKKPIFAGTYFPKNDQLGMAGMMRIINKISVMWATDKNELITRSEKIMAGVSRANAVGLGRLERIDSEVLFKRVFSELVCDFDQMYGGFGNAPKFPSPHNLYFLLRYWHLYKDERALQMVEKTLEGMKRGGIFDCIGYGFSRYSTDRKWLVPHFEKMLYDNSLLAIAYLECFQATKNPKYSEVAMQIFTYILRDLISPEGGFYTAEDADSEGEEGKFYCWTVEEVVQVLGNKDGKKFCKYFDITTSGNFENKNIPNLIMHTVPKEEKVWSEEKAWSEEKVWLEECRQKMFDYRNTRVHPFKDDKVLSSLNGLTIAALSIAGRVLGITEYTEAAEKSGNFIFAKLVRSDGRLLARYRDGHSDHLGFVDDYAFLIWGLIELYETTYNPDYLKNALKLNDDLIRLFCDEKSGGLFLYGIDGEQLIARPKEIYDGAIPSGNSVATLNFLRLARLTGRFDLEEKAKLQFATFSQNLQSVPRGQTYFLMALMFAEKPTNEIMIICKDESHDGSNDESNVKDSRRMVNIINEEFRPFTVSMVYSKDKSTLSEVAPFVVDYKMKDDKTTAYICENFTCNKPVTSIEEFRRLL